MPDNKLFKIGITHGDINSTNYEMIMKALSEPKLMEVCTPIVYGLSKVASYYRKTIDMNDFAFQFIKNIDQATLKKPNLLNIAEHEVKIEMGIPTKISAGLSVNSLQEVVKDLKNNKVDAIVTAPSCKEPPEGKNSFKGDSQFLIDNFKANDTLLMLVAEEIKIGVISHRKTLNQVVQQLSIELLMKKIRTLHHALIKDFLITHPKIAVLSFNPSNDAEENEKIIPAINQAFEEKISVFGPFLSSELFQDDRHRQFDAILALHDEQGMTPFRLLSENRGILYSAGLPIVHTAPVDAADFKNAGKNCISGQSLRNAIYWAIDILRNRREV